MKTGNVAATVALLVGTAWCTPSVRIQSLDCTPDVPHVVTVAYTLSEDAIVTASVLTNGVALSGDALDALGGDVNRRIKATGEGIVRTLKWFPDASFEGHQLDAASVRVELKAWPLESPPDYMVVDLRVASNLCYYATEDSLPGKIGDVVYKSDKLVMRKIRAKDVHWVMGTSSNYVNSLGGDAPEISRELVHRVRLTHDYYIGVYPVTEAQHELIDRQRESASRLPKSAVSFASLRGTDKGSQWPSLDEEGNLDVAASHSVDATSWIGKFRSRTGLVWADLPTEAQWEFAARAGEKALLPGGEVITAAAVGRYARFDGNLAEPDCEGLTASRATVGSYRPNGWGLYDVLGNVLEWCLDWRVNWNEIGLDVSAEQVDPFGARVGTSRLMRGSYYSAPWNWTYVSQRQYGYPPETASGIFGFRLVVTLY